ncbi:MAG: hypothetical protein K9H48_07815 [Melioribacteraceae bacterium]|nr:hypothetical protein [Melioribacteraceae bacterium]
MTNSIHKSDAVKKILFLIKSSKKKQIPTIVLEEKIGDIINDIVSETCQRLKKELNL